MQIPNINDHLMPAGSNNNVDYIIPKDKDMKYKLAMVAQFVDACINDKETLGYPNDNYHLGFIIDVRSKGVRTQLIIPVDSQEQMNDLQAQANSRFRAVGN